MNPSQAPVKYHIDMSRDISLSNNGQIWIMANNRAVYHDAALQGYPTIDWLIYLTQQILHIESCVPVTVGVS